MNKSWPFQHPVKEDEAPGYSDIIKQPMDLSTMEVKLQKGEYVTKESFESDFMLMTENCRKYNDAATIYVRNANSLEKKFKSLIKHV